MPCGLIQIRAPHRLPSPARGSSSPTAAYEAVFASSREKWGVGSQEAAEKFQDKFAEATAEVQKTTRCMFLLQRTYGRYTFRSVHTQHQCQRMYVEAKTVVSGVRGQAVSQSRKSLYATRVTPTTAVQEHDQLFYYAIFSCYLLVRLIVGLSPES